MLSEADTAQFISRLDRLGVSQVRDMLPTGGWTPTLEPTVRKWLSDKDKEAEHLREASQAEQINIARDASIAAQHAAVAAERASAAAERQATAAERATTTATIALVIAIISMITSIIGIIGLNFITRIISLAFS